MKGGGVVHAGFTVRMRWGRRARQRGFVERGESVCRRRWRGTHLEVIDPLTRSSERRHTHDSKRRRGTTGADLDRPDRSVCAGRRAWPSEDDLNSWRQPCPLKMGGPTRAWGLAPITWCSDIDVQATEVDARPGPRLVASKSCPLPWGDVTHVPHQPFSRSPFHP